MLWIWFFIWFCSFFLSWCGFFYYLDTHYPDKRHYPSDVITLKQQYQTFAPTVFFNLFVLIPLFLIPTLHWTTFDSSAFSIRFLLQEMAWFALTFDFYFFTSHKILHQSWLFQHVHYKHHQMVDSIGFGSIYAHPFEFWFSNYMPFALPVLIGWNPPHMETVIVWTAIAASYIVLSHSGYAFPHRNPKHLFHHRYVNQYYGTIGIMDGIWNKGRLFYQWLYR